MWLIALLMAGSPAVAGKSSSSVGVSTWKRPTKLQLIQYRQHVNQTRALDKLKAKIAPVARYDFGMVNIKALGTHAVIGHVAVQKGVSAGEIREDWFFADPGYYDDPGAEFTLQMDQVGSFGFVDILSYLWTETGGFASYGWHRSSYVVREVPQASTVVGLVTTNPMVETYTFDLVQGGSVVGGMHREAHLDFSGNPTKMVDHYIVHSGKKAGGSLATLLKSGHTLEVHTAGTQSATTYGFFFAQGSFGTDNYSKVEYDVGDTASAFVFP